MSMFRRLLERVVDLPTLNLYTRLRIKKRTQMNITKTTITKTTFTITLDSITQHYMANMLECLQNYSKDDLESSIGELDLFSANAKDLSRRNVDTIKRLFENGSTHMLLDARDFNAIERAEIDKENWEILVVVDFNKELVCIPSKDVDW